MQGLADHAYDEVCLGFRSSIDDLEPDQLQQIVALLWLGRGDGTLEDWPELLEQAQDDWNPSTVEYLIAPPFLADSLLEALAMRVTTASERYGNRARSSCPAMRQTEQRWLG